MLVLLQIFLLVDKGEPQLHLATIIYDYMYESYKINTKNYCIIFIMYDFRFLRCSCVATLEKSNNEADYLQREDISEWRQIQNHYYSKIRRCTTRQYFAPSFLP